jgi:hypothetical protein
MIYEQYGMSNIVLKYLNDLYSSKVQSEQHALTCNGVEKLTAALQEDTRYQNLLAHIETTKELFNNPQLMLLSQIITDAINQKSK